MSFQRSDGCHILRDVRFETGKDLLEFLLPIPSELVRDVGAIPTILGPLFQTPLPAIPLRQTLRRLSFESVRVP